MTTGLIHHAAEFAHFSNLEWVNESYTVSVFQIINNVVPNAVRITLMITEHSYVHVDTVQKHFCPFELTQHIFVQVN